MLNNMNVKVLMNDSDGIFTNLHEHYIRPADRPLPHVVLLLFVGMTESEIDNAIKLAASVQPTQSPTATTSVAPTMAPPLPPRPLTPPQPVVQQRTWKDYAVTVAVIGGVGYALFHFVRVGADRSLY